MLIALAILIFALTLFLVLTRPRGLSEAWSTAFGAALMLALRVVTIRQAWDVVMSGGNVLLFLAGLLVLSNLLRESGFFEWAAIYAVRLSRGRGKNLYRNVFLLGAATTALLSLDTTAVILTPIVLAIIRRLRLRSFPFVITCAFVANAGSLLLPVSNLTNLLFVKSFHWHFATFTWTMILPQAAVLLLNYLIFTKLFKNEIPTQFDATSVPDPQSVIININFFRGGVCILGLVIAGYFVGPLVNVAPYLVALGGSISLMIWGVVQRQRVTKAFREVSWSIFPFVIGLFVMVRGVEQAGLTALMDRGLAQLGHSQLTAVFGTTYGAALGSNLFNNIPMALLSIESLSHGSSTISRCGALIGCDLGPNIMVSGSLATMLVISYARNHGEQISGLDFFKIGIVTTPILLAAAVVILCLVSPLIH